MIPVVLSGGSGSRLWPLSRGVYPKQLLPIVDQEVTMLQQTLQRVEGMRNLASPIVVCGEEHRFMVGEQCQQLGLDATIMLEPEARNTAPAIALAAWAAMAQQDDVLMVMPADHVIADVALFQRVAQAAIDLAEKDQLVTLGVVPQSPETGYGYIKADKDAEPRDFYDVLEFKEKPSLELAQCYLDSGDYYWNSGIFVFKASSYLSELKALQPDIYHATQKAAAGAALDLDFIRIDNDEFLQSPAISIDYAVMEKTTKAKVIPLDVGWNDVGSWSALWAMFDKDAQGNVVKGDVLLHETNNSHVYADSKMVAVIGADDLIVVEMNDVVMVVHRDSAQSVKCVVDRLKKQGRTQVDTHRKVYRPWGWYDCIDDDPGFQVKRIQVKPGAQLSVQRHQYRAEHWVVISGVAEVLKGDDVIRLIENESINISIGEIHSLKNPSQEQALEIIEIQTGSYLGEDDIERLDDLYGRK